MQVSERSSDPLNERIAYSRKHKFADLRNRPFTVYPRRRSAESSIHRFTQLLKNPMGDWLIHLIGKSSVRRFLRTPCMLRPSGEMAIGIPIAYPAILNPTTLEDQNVRRLRTGLYQLGPPALYGPI